MEVMGFFARLFGKLDNSPESRRLVRYHAVVDTSDDTLVAIGNHPIALLFLSESLMDTRYVSNIISDDVLLIKMAGPRAHPEWSWNNSKRAFKKTNPAIITEDMRERAVLAAKKVEAISRIMYWINGLRGKINTGLLFQEAIYAEKERQARSLKDANFDEHQAAEAPYVVQ